MFIAFFGELINGNVYVDTELWRALERKKERKEHSLTCTE
jgi:hypothetical protein